jgi:hypothetical protein
LLAEAAVHADAVALRVNARLCEKAGFLFAVVADGFDGAAFHGFLAKAFLGFVLGLLEDVGMSAVLVAREVCGRSFAAEIAVDALVINVEFARHVFWVFVCFVSHKECFGLKMKGFQNKGIGF